MKTCKPRDLSIRNGEIDLLDSISTSTRPSWGRCSKSAQFCSTNAILVVGQSQWHDEPGFAFSWIISTTQRLGDYCQRHRYSLCWFHISCPDSRQIPTPSPHCGHHSKPKKIGWFTPSSQLFFSTRGNVLCRGYISRQRSMWKKTSLFRWTTLVPFQRRFLYCIDDLNSLQLFTSRPSRLFINSKRRNYVLRRLSTIRMLKYNFLVFTSLDSFSCSSQPSLGLLFQWSWPIGFFPQSPPLSKPSVLVSGLFSRPTLPYIRHTCHKNRAT